MPLRSRCVTVKLMKRNTAIILLALLFFPVFTSCTARINGALLRDGQADLNVYAALEPRMTMLIGGLAAAAGSLQPGAPILNGPSISASMSAAPGIASVSFKNVTPAVIEGPVKILHVGDFLKIGGLAGEKQDSQSPGFIKFEQNPAGGRCTINLNRDSGPEILNLISPEVGVYLSALMAPIATGETLTKADYLMLVSSVYGRGISDEIAKAAILAYIDFPGSVSSVKGGTFSGRRAEFNVPLVDLLVLETPLSYEVLWK